MRTRLDIITGQPLTCATCHEDADTLNERNECHRCQAIGDLADEAEKRLLRAAEEHRSPVVRGLATLYRAFFG